MITRTCLVALAVTLAACAPEAPPAEEAQPADTTAAAAPPPAGDAFIQPDTMQMQRSETGLFIQDLHEGTGEPLQAGQNAAVHYTGWLIDGTKFDSSRDRGEPYVVEQVGQAPVIPGWNQGLQGMKVGGHRLLVIPPALGYSVGGMPPVIPPNATLVFQIELVRIQ